MLVQGLTQAEVARRLGVSRAAVTQALVHRDLTLEAQTAIETVKVSVRDLRAAARLAPEEQLNFLLRQAETTAD